MFSVLDFQACRCAVLFASPLICQPVKEQQDLEITSLRISHTTTHTPLICVYSLTQHFTRKTKAPSSHNRAASPIKALSEGQILSSSWRLVDNLQRFLLRRKSEFLHENLKFIKVLCHLIATQVNLNLCHVTLLKASSFNYLFLYL